MIRSKKGGEKLLSLWWFFSLTVIGAGIVFGVLSYYSAELEIKGVEANVMADKLVRCIDNQGFLNNEVLKDNFDALKQCGFSEKMFSSGIFYFNISIYDKNGNSLKEIVKGAGSFQADCQIQEESKIKAKHYPKCAKKDEKIYYYQGQIQEGTIKILAASNQYGGNA